MVCRYTEDGNDDGEYQDMAEFKAQTAPGGVCGDGSGAAPAKLEAFDWFAGDDVYGAMSDDAPGRAGNGDGSGGGGGVGGGRRSNGRHAAGARANGPVSPAGSVCWDAEPERRRGCSRDGRRSPTRAEEGWQLDGERRVRCRAAKVYVEYEMVWMGVRAPAGKIGSRERKMGVCCLIMLRRHMPKQPHIRRDRGVQPNRESMPAIAIDGHCHIG